MHREWLPFFQEPLVSVTTRLPGASPAEAEELVTIPVEEAVSDVPGVASYVSTSTQGLSRVEIEFEEDVEDLGAAVQRVSDALNAVDTLPEGTVAPVIQLTEVNPPTLEIAVTAEAEPVLQQTVRYLEKELDRLHATDVDVEGLLARRIYVEAQPDVLAAAGVDMDVLAQAIASRARNVVGGRTGGAVSSWIVRGISRTSSAAEIENIVLVTDAAGHELTIGDVADVTEGYAAPTTAVRVDGRPAAILSIVKRPGADALEVNARARERIEELRDELPSEVALVFHNDTTKYVSMLQPTLVASGLFGFAIVLFLLWLFVGWRGAFVAALGMPVALAGGLLVMHLQGISLNIASLVALILCVGIMVDDSVIVIENVSRLRRAGMELREAVIQGLAEVMWPVISSTLTTCAAFAPLLMMSGGLGEIFGVLPKVVIAVLGASLIEALFIMPAHMMRFGAGTTFAGPAWFEAWLRRLRDAYDAGLVVCVRYKKTTLAVAYGLFVVTCLITLTTQEIVALDPRDPSWVRLHIEMPAGTARQQTNEVVSRIERRILGERDADVEALVSKIGTGGEHNANIYLFLVADDQRSRPDAGAQWEEKIRALAGELIEPSEVQVTSEVFAPLGSAVSVSVTGNERVSLERLASEIATELRHIDGVLNVTQDVRGGQPELLVVVDDARAGAYGIEAQTVARWIGHAFGEAPVAETMSHGEPTGIVVTIPRAFREDADALADIPIATPAGGTIALRNVATLRRTASAPTLNRREGRPVVTISATLAEGATSQAVNRDLRARIQPFVAANPGIGVHFGGEFEETERSIADLRDAFGVALLLIFVILAAQFRSYIQPLVVLGAIPLSLTGACIAFLLSGRPIGLISLVGVIGLSGIVVNDSMVFVDFVNRRRQEGVPLLEALRSAGRDRMRPIVLTSITTVGGLLSLAILDTGSVFSPIAIAMVGGLTYATVLVLFVLPCLLAVVDAMQDFFRNRIGGLLGRTRRMSDSPDN